jgi:hypothetical protein
MQLAADIILNTFLGRHPSQVRERLLRHLPQSECKRLQNMEPAPPVKSMPAADDLLKQVHWSWFLPTLKSCLPQEQPLFLSVLTSASARALAGEIPCKLLKGEITFMGQSYLKEVLLNSLVGPHGQLLPINYLPLSPLNRLLQLSKLELIRLIDLLAMHDLIVEIRQIVETKILKKIYSFLSEDQRQFLKAVTARHELMSSQRTGLDRWDGSAKSLRHLLHKKGLARFSAALCGQNSSLAWYVCHRLDIGRGSALFKLCVGGIPSAAMDIAERQTEELLGYIL